MSATFNRAVARVIEFEGGDKITRDPDDPGQTTRFGIAQRYHPGVDVEHLSLEDAISIYRVEYWDRIRGDQLPAPLAMVVFDCAVIPGQERAARFLQRILRLEEDGVIGAETIAAARHTGPATVIAHCALRSIYFSEEVQRRPRKAKYLEGWQHRVLLAHREAVLLESQVQAPAETRA